MGRRKLLTREDVLEAIRRLLVRRGVPPTVEELRRELGVGSSRTIHRYLTWLEEENDIERWEGARGIRLLRQPQPDVQTRAVPLVGDVAAGPAMLAEENIESWVRFPKDFLKPASANFFLLRVRGDSMNHARVGGERIEDRDLVLVQQRSTADPNDIVVAVVDGEATIKRLKKGRGYYVLTPESSRKGYQPIILDRDFQVQGIVRRVLKKGASVLEQSLA